MKTDDFNFDLPERLIAQHPSAQRGGSRLFVLDRGAGGFTHAMVRSLADYLEPGTLMVFNDSRVRKARLLGVADDTEAEVEFLLLGPVTGQWGDDRREAAPGTLWRAMCQKAKRQKTGRTYTFPGGMRGRIAEEHDDERIVEFHPPVDEAYLERHGHIPLPPYIRRSDEAEDAERYQTIYAREVGSAACPTAGLHFTEDLLHSLDARGIERRSVTLHVGLGTFLPVRTESIESHRMHEEWYSVPPDTAEAVNRARREGRPVLAVGTTSLRTLESAWKEGEHGAAGALRAGTSSTSIFIYPGYRFRVVDRLFTNFHTPKSTLFMLVSAFAGEARIKAAYAEAIERDYRFFSYGDAMLIR